jgi:hypothetical protein
MNNKKFIGYGLLLSIFAIVGVIGLNSILPFASGTVAFGQPEGVDPADPGRGVWIEAYLEPDNTDLLVDACFVLGQIVSGDSSNNEAGELGSSDGVIVALKILSNFNVIDWAQNHWEAGETAADEFQMFCPQSSSGE